MRFFDALWIDARQSLRRLRHAPALSIAAIATIVVVLSANTAIFSLLNAIVLRKVAIDSPDELIAISATDARTGQVGYFYLDSVKAFRAAQQSFAQLAMYNGGGTLPVEPVNSPTLNLGTEAVSPEYFELARVRPLAGRFLTEADESGPPSVVLSYRIAQRVFGDAAGAVGQRLRINGIPTLVVGVAEPGFTGVALDGGSDLFILFTTFRSLLTNPNPAIRSPYLVARLANGVSIAQARSELAARWPAIQEATIGSVPAAVRTAVSTQRVSLESLANGFSGLRRQYGRALTILMGLTALLLAIGATNLSGLLLARGLAREHEFAVQRALGATGARVLQRSILEGLVLAFAGLAIALPIAWGLTRSLTPLLVARALPLQRPLTPSLTVFAVSAAATVLTGVVIGLLPAWRAINVQASGVLRSGRTTARTMGWAGRGVIVTQVALAMVLLSGAGLFAATLANLYANDSNARSKPILWTRLSQQTGLRDNPTETYLRSLVDGLMKVPGADAAALSFYYPSYLGFPGVVTNTTIALPGNTDASTTGMVETVTPGFFDLTGITRRRGRDFSWADGAKAPAVAVISQSVADRLFSAADPIGREIQTNTSGTVRRLRIVGVVANAPIGRIDEPDVAVVFVPMAQNLGQAVVPLAHVRVGGDLTSARQGYVDAVNGLGRHYVRALFTVDDWVDDALLQQRLVAGVSSAAALIAVLLAAIGLCGVLAYSVTARFREIGIRMSLGATHRSIGRLVMREGMGVVAAGLLIGIPLAAAASRLIQSQLYGVTAGDPAWLALAAVLFALASAVAAWLPARRASRIEPIDALRQD